MPEPGHMLLKQQDTRKLYGTKNCCTYLQLGQILGKRYRAQKLSRRFWRARSENRLLEAKAGHQVYTLHAAPPAGCANRLSHPSCLAVDARPPSPHRGTSLPPGGASKQGNLLFVPTPPCCSCGPSKALCDTRCGIQIPFRYMMQEYQLENEHQNWPWNSGSPGLHTKMSKPVLQKIVPQLKHLRFPPSSWNKFTIKIFKSQGDTYYPKENQQLWPTVELAFQELERATISKY